MQPMVRLRRSALYMPGANARALDKARGLPADALILDLEDAVAPAAKAEARRQVLAALAAGGYGQREVAVRVNGLDTPWGRDDIAAIARAGADAVVLPKVEGAAAVADLRQRLATAGAPADLALWAMIETPRGVLKAAEIAESPGLACLVMGTSDLAKELRARHTADRQPMLTALSLVLLAARANRLAVLDGVFLDLRNDAGFAAACRQGVELGFDGKTLIHPSQIAAANAAFGPSPEAVAEARRIVAAFAEVEAAGKGVAVLDGRLIENLHMAEARRLLALAQAVEDG
ncbi:MAG: CoA ester lyase [Alphaproteobacteria bacterium]|nr:CoA ester lyase [Alphaproteobacteria bacterium]